MTIPPVAVLTGGTSGLGRHIAHGLVQAGWHVVLIARDPARAVAMLDWLGEDNIEMELADLSLLAEARRAAAAIIGRYRQIGLLVLNAGTFQARRIITSEGHEHVLAVNHLVPFALIDACSHALAPSARIVVTGSSSADHARIDPDNLELTHGWNLVHAYAQSKLALLTTSLHWAKLLTPAVALNVVHPGFVATDLVRERGVIRWVWRRIGHFGLTAEQGAAAPLKAALDPTLAGLTGRYLTPRGFRLPNARAIDPALAPRVWAATQRLVAP